MGTEPVEAYDNNLEYLQDELRWIEIRCKRLITQRQIEQKGEPGWKQYGETEPVSKLEARAKRQEKLEKKRRGHIDRRLELTCESNFSLAIEELVELYGLDSFERTILLLASAVAFSRRFEELYGDLQNSFTGLTVESIFNFCELPFAKRITRRRVFAKSGRLVQNDLISMDIHSRFNAPEDLLVAQVQVSNRTFGYLVGDNELMDEFIEFSSVE